MFATPKNNNLPPSAFGDDSRLRLALAAQKKHTTCKCNISAREPGGTDVILAHFLFFHPYKKCAKITSVPPGSLADMLYLHVVCFFCAASARQRRESSPKADGGRLLFLGVANKFRNGNKLSIGWKSSSEIDCWVANYKYSMLIWVYYGSIIFLYQSFL